MLVDVCRRRTRAIRQQNPLRASPLDEPTARRARLAELLVSTCLPARARAHRASFEAHRYISTHAAAPQVAFAASNNACVRLQWRMTWFAAENLPRRSTTQSFRVSKQFHVFSLPYITTIRHYHHTTIPPERRLPFLVSLQFRATNSEQSSNMAAVEVKDGWITVKEWRVALCLAGRGNSSGMGHRGRRLLHARVERD